MFLKLFLGLVMGASCVQASPMVGYATQMPENQYRILNAKGEIVYQQTADLVKRVELRDGLALVQLTSNHVSVIREDGSVMVDRVLGSEVLISNTLVAIYTRGGIGSVYTLQGKQVFPLSASDRGRPLSKIWIANERFAVMDSWLDAFTVFDRQGSELFSSRMISKAYLSDGFMALYSALGSFTLYDSEFNVLTTSPQATEVRISDSFAAFRDVGFTLRLFSVQSGEITRVTQASEFSLTNSYALVHDSFGWTAYGRDGSVLETILNARSVVTSHQLLASVGITGALTVRNLESGDSFTLNLAESFLMSDDLLLVKNGMGAFSVYSLNSSTFGALAHSFMSSVIYQFQTGNGVVSFETRLPTASSNSAQVYRISPSGAATVKNLLVDEVRVGWVNVSVNREEWNWQ